MNSLITLFLMVEYKDARKVSIFLAPEDYDENKKTIFVNLDDPNLNIEETFNYLINDWMGFIFNLPVTTPIFFDLVQEGRKHSYKATPEKINTILNCLQTRNFDEIISSNPISSDPPENIEGISHVSGFGIRVYSFIPQNTNIQRAGSFLTMSIKKIFLSALKIN